MTTVDRYYREWARYQSEHQAEPNDRQLAHHLEKQGLLSRSGRPIAPSTLRRYLPGFRIYHVWLELVEENGAEPSIDELEQLVAKRGITGKYNARLEARDLEPFLDDFRRRLAAMQPHSVAALS